MALGCLSFWVKPKKVWAQLKFSWLWVGSCLIVVKNFYGWWGKVPSDNLTDNQVSIYLFTFFLWEQLLRAYNPGDKPPLRQLTNALPRLWTINPFRLSLGAEMELWPTWFLTDMAGSRVAHPSRPSRYGVRALTRHNLKTRSRRQAFSKCLDFIANVATPARS